METLGYTPAVRAFLKTCPDFGVGLKIDIEYTCVPGRIDWAYEVLGLQGDPIWEFLKAKAVQMMQWEDKVRALSLLVTSKPIASCGASALMSPPICPMQQVRRFLRVHNLPLVAQEDGNGR